MLRLLLASSLAPALAAFAPCCAYGGEGSAVALGMGVFDAFPPPRGSPSGAAPTGAPYSGPLAIGISASGSFAPFATVLFAARSGPEDSVAGWIVTSNATNDVLYAWSNAAADVPPTCVAGVGPRGAFISEYSMCAGSGIFSRLDREYSLAPNVPMGVFAQASNASTLTFAGGAAGCTPTTLLGSSSPLGTGAYSIAFESGVPEAPPSTWSAPPSWCAGKWEQ